MGLVYMTWAAMSLNGLRIAGMTPINEHQRMAQYGLKRMGVTATVVWAGAVPGLIMSRRPFVFLPEREARLTTGPTSLASVLRRTLSPNPLRFVL